MSRVCRKDFLLGMDSLGKQLERARAHAGDWSRSRLSHATGKVNGRPYISEPTIEAIEVGKTKRPNDETILRLGEALEVPDDVFPAYALAQARRELDEWQVGAKALTNLRALAAGATPAPLGELARRLEVPQTNAGSRQRKRRPPAAGGSRGSER